MTIHVEYKRVYTSRASNCNKLDFTPQHLHTRYPHFTALVLHITEPIIISNFELQNHNVLYITRIPSIFYHHLFNPLIPLGIILHFLLFLLFWDLLMNLNRFSSCGIEAECFFPVRSELTSFMVMRYLVNSFFRSIFLLVLFKHYK